MGVTQETASCKEQDWPWKWVPISLICLRILLVFSSWFEENSISLDICLLFRGLKQMKDRLIWVCLKTGFKDHIFGP